MPESGYIAVYSTFASEEQAQNIANALVEKGLVACANIFPGVKSIYKWKGRVETAAEFAMFAKTRKALFPAVKNLIIELHDYEIPCIVAYDIAGGDEKFLSWVEKETVNS